MAKRKKPLKQVDGFDLQAMAEMKCQPFAELKLPMPPEEPEPEPKPEVETPKPAKPQLLCEADRELLNQWGATEALDIQQRCLLKLKIGLRKVKGGRRQCTVIRGFTTDDAQYMMELTGLLKRFTGVEVFFKEGAFELPGNWLNRLDDFFLAQGYELIPF